MASASLTDDLLEKTMNDIADKGPKIAEKAIKVGGKATKKVTKTAANAVSNAVKGICLILEKGVDFTTENVMNAINEKALQKTGDIKYSKRNVSIGELSKSGNVKKIDEAVTADVMRHFDSVCKSAGIKYSAMKNEKESQYYIFYEGKTADVILHAMGEAYKGYMSEQEHKQKNQGKEKNRDGVRAKIAFFRDRVAAIDKETNNAEKKRTHSEPQR